MDGGRRQDAVEARDRALRAMVSATDVATRVSLWRLALRYNNRDILDAREDGFLAALQS